VEVQDRRSKFAVEFDDGDFCGDIKPDDIISKKRYFGCKPTAAWEGSSSSPSGGPAASNGCDCSMCSKPACTKCHACLFSGPADCFQKVSH